jgi:hypothetical protein
MLDQSSADQVEIEYRETDVGTDRWSGVEERLLVEAGSARGFDAVSRQTFGHAPSFFNRRGDRYVKVVFRRRATDSSAPSGTPTASPYRRQLLKQLSECHLEEPPDWVALIVHQQRRAFAASPEAAASAVREIWREPERSHVTQRYQVVVAGQAFWWNSGSTTPEFLLPPHTDLDPDSYFVRISGSMAVEPGQDMNEVVRAVASPWFGTTSELDLLVIDRSGLTHEYRMA